MTDVTLKPIPACPGYFAGSDGSIWSAMPGRNGRYTAIHPLRLHRDKQGYLRVTIRSVKKRSYFVHQLVAVAFHGLCPDGLVVRHGIGGQTDNRPENLRYGTQAANIADKRRDGTHICGDRSYLAKVTDDQAREIYRRANAGESRRLLAQEFGVSKAMVNALMVGRIRRHLSLVSAPREAIA